MSPDEWTLSGRAFSRSCVAGSAPGTQTFAMLWSPQWLEPEERVAAFVDIVDVSHTIDPSHTPVNYQGFDFRLVEATNPMGALGAYLPGFNKMTGGPESVCQVRYGTVQPGAIPNIIVRELWQPRVSRQDACPFSPAILVKPGWGLMVCSAEAVCIQASFQWREVPLSEIP